MNLSSSSKPSAKESYDKWHASHELEANSDTPWYRLVKNRLIPERDITGKKILEIGCGQGGFARWLATREGSSPTISAADFSETAIKIARARELDGLNPSSISWHVQDIERMDFPAESFDTVISCETIEHVPDPRRAIGELSRVLKPGGRLFLTCPNYLGPQGLYRIYLRLRGRRFAEEGQPINRFLLFPLTRHWVSSAGLSVEHSDGIGHTIPFPGRAGIKLPIDSPKTILKWFAQHAFLVAKK